jgi:hypothetical protein
MADPFGYGSYRTGALGARVLRGANCPFRDGRSIKSD